MSPAGVITAAAAPSAVLDATPVGQLTSEGLGLTVAALIALAVLAVLGAALVMLLRRRQVQARPLARHGDTGADAGTLWAAGEANGAVRNGGAAATDTPDAEDADSTGGEAIPRGEEAPPEAAGGRGAGARPRPDPQPRPLHEALIVRPPLPREAWEAEIFWIAHATRFRVVARRSDDPDAEPVAIAQTEPLPWPPRDDASVQALTDASSTLEAVLLDSGWSALPTGEAWYSKRFAWAPAAAAADPRPGTGRFDRRRAPSPDKAARDAVAQDAGSR